MILDNLFNRKKEPIPSAEEMKKLTKLGAEARDKEWEAHQERLYQQFIDELNKRLRDHAKISRQKEIEFTVSFGDQNNYKKFEDYVASQGYKIEVQFQGLSKIYKISW